MLFIYLLIFVFLLLFIPSNVASNATYSSNISLTLPFILTDLATVGASDSACVLTLRLTNFCSIIFVLLLPFDTVWAI